MALVTAVLAFFHILSAMAWLGGGILFAFVIAPKFAKLQPSSTRDFFVTIQPGVIRFFQIVAGLTILFGLLLLYDSVGGDWSKLSLSTSWGFDISLGMTVAIVAFVISEFIAVPTFLRLVRLFQAPPPEVGQMPAELPILARRAALQSFVLVGLLLVAMAFMVGAGYY